MTRDKFIGIFKNIKKEMDIFYYNTNTGNINAPSTITRFITDEQLLNNGELVTIETLKNFLMVMSDNGIIYVDRDDVKHSIEDLIETISDEDLYESEKELEAQQYKNMNNYQYFKTAHWKEVVEEKLSESPTCEGCGRKATKVLLKNWDNKGMESNEDVWALCGSCSIVKGEIITRGDVKEEIIRNLPMYDKVFEEIAIIVIQDKAKKMLSGEIKTKNITKAEVKETFREIYISDKKRYKR